MIGVQMMMVMKVMGGCYHADDDAENITNPAWMEERESNTFVLITDAWQEKHFAYLCWTGGPAGPSRNKHNRTLKSWRL